MVTIGSIVRDGSGYIGRYFKQIEDLRKHIPVNVIITEGDSTDNTWALIQNREGVTPFKYDHKGAKYGSVNVKERWKNIARTWNHMLSQAGSIKTPFIYLEADLLWDSKSMLSLIEGLSDFDAVAPMCFHGNIFYDTWGHRAFGRHFTNLYPYHANLTDYDRYMPIESAGSCIVMKSEVINSCRLSEVDAMIGHDIITKGYSFVVDKKTRIYHP